MKIEHTKKIAIDPTRFEFFFKGEKMKIDDVAEIHRAYEILCTAEYIVNNYSEYNEYDAYVIASYARHIMDKYNYDEGTAITEAADKFDKGEML